MDSSLLLVLAPLALLLLAALMAVVIYNRLVTLKGRFENAFAQIAVQLKRRYDLIPNIVETAKKYLEHESSTLRQVIEARNEALTALRGAAANPGDVASIEALNMAEKNFSANFRGLRLQMEAYPELKANTVIAQLSEELISTENRLAFARQAFNDAVTKYNIQRRSFPTNLLAGPFGHASDAALLGFDDAQSIQEAPKVSF